FCEMSEGRPRLVKEHNGLPVRRPHGRPLGGLAKIADSLWPSLRMYRMKGKTLRLTAPTLSVQAADRVDGSPVKLPPPVPEETRIRHFVSQRMLEGVLSLRECACVVEKLSNMQVGEAPPTLLLIIFIYFCEQRLRK